MGSPRRQSVVVGPAGSGKTLALMRRVLPWIRRDQEDREPRRWGRSRPGPWTGGRLGLSARAILVLPTYGQVEHIRRLFLLRFPDRRGLLEAPVVTFTSLAERVVDHPIRRLLTGPEKDLVLRHVLRESPPSFARVARYAGFRSTCLEVLKEIKENGLPVAEAADVLRARGEAAGGPARERLAALSTVLVRYHARLETAGLLDHEDLLVQLRDRLEEDGTLLAGLEALAVDGFTDFTRVERDILRRLAARSRRTWVSLTIGSGPPREDVFQAAEETAETLLARGYRVLRLRRTPRFRRGEIRALEAGLFAPGTEPAEDGGAVEMLVATDVEDETDRLARRAARLIREDGVRPHEIGVLVRSFETYRDLLPEAFERHGVPLLVHASRPLAGEPAARAVLLLLRVLADGWRGEDVRDLLLASALAPGEAGPDEVDAFLASRPKPRLPEGREAWLAEVEGFEAVRTALRAAADEETAIREAAGVAAAADRVRGWWGGLLRPEDPRESGRARREAEAVRALSGALDGVVRALEAVGERGAPLETFARAVREAVDGTDVRDRSRRFETVHAISVEESRQWELPVVLVAGLLEGVFPRRPREDIFLRDRERAEMNRDGRLLLKERLRTSSEERQLFYMAATRARDRLVLSRPAAGRDGSPLLGSFFLRDVARVFTEDSWSRATTRRPRAAAATAPEETTGRPDLRRRALLGLGEPWRPGAGTGRAAHVAAALHDRLVADDDRYRRSLAVGLRFRGTPDAAIDDPGLLARVAERRAVFSATSLKTWAWCPYEDFARSTLGLGEPEDDVVGRMDLGRVAHEALRAVLAGEAEPEDAFDRAVETEIGGRETDLAAQRGLRDLRERVIDLARSERERLRRQGLTAEALERVFGPEEVSLGGVPLRGVLDRVDVAEDGTALVLDYKLKVTDSSKKMLEAIENGWEFQLPVYLEAARTALGRTAVAALLLPIEKGVPRGVVREDVADRGLPERAKPAPLPAEALDALVEASAGRIAAIAAAVHAGEIVIRPRETTRCERGRCPYLDLCRVEPWVLEAERAEAEP